MTCNYPWWISNALKRNNILDFPGGKWIRIHPPMQVTQVQSLVQEYSTCSEQLRLCPTATEPTCWNYWNPHVESVHTTTREGATMRSPCITKKSKGKPTHYYRKPAKSNKDPTQPIINIIFKKRRKNNICSKFSNRISPFSFKWELRSLNLGNSACLFNNLLAFSMRNVYLG